VLLDTELAPNLDLLKFEAAIGFFLRTAKPLCFYLEREA